MKIERILPPGPAAKRWTLVLEDGETLSVGEGEMADFALFSGMELSHQEQERLLDAAATSALRGRAAAILGRRPCSKGELRLRLQQAGATEAQGQEIACWAEEIGLIHEERYAQDLARHYSARGYGPYKIKDELYRRHIPRELWDLALDGLEGQEEAIARYLERHLKARDPKSLKKAADALGRRGFAWQEIGEALGRFTAGEEDY